MEWFLDMAKRYKILLVTPYKDVDPTENYYVNIYT